MQNLLRGEPLKLVNGGQSQRTFVYIKDAVEAFLLMIVGEMVISSTWVTQTMRLHLVEIMIQVKVSGEETPIINVSSKEFYGERYDNRDKRIPYLTIINGWNPKTSLWDMLESTLTY
ncbi:hypothetical protein Lal_00019225 [Lupinus albus]|nr:hypothetical protein Lal_00019225 [Lupinus albus]